MASTVNQAFNDFLKEIEPHESEKKKIVKRHQYIRETLREKIKNDNRKSDFLTGSYARHTQIRPINDIDIIITFDRNEYWGKYGNNPKLFLSYLKRKLKEIYPNSEFRTQTHSIGINFSEAPNVDVVPAFIIDYENEIYQIPDREFTRYIETSPPKHQELISNFNTRLNQKFIPIIKILKKWRQTNDIKLKSFHLEVFCMQIFKTPFGSFQDGLEFFFTNASTEIMENCLDPIGISGELDDYLSIEEKIRLSKIFKETSLFVNNAVILEKNGQHQESIELWNELLGNPFSKPLIPSVGISGSSKPRKKTKFPPEGRNPRFGYKI